MASWDREAVLEDYAARFDAAADAEALMEELGTPTRVAYVLGQGYVPTPPPGLEPEAPAAPAAPAPAKEEATPQEEAALPSLETLLEEVSSEEFWSGPAEPETAPEEPQAETPAEPEAPAEAPAPAAEATEPPAPVTTEEPPAPPRRRLRFGGLLGFLGLCVVPGLPVAALLFVVGVPFMALGVLGALFLLRVAQGALPEFRLWSDSLLLCGAGLAVLAVCLLLFWLGAWISLRLCRLWVREALVPWGRRMIWRETEVGA